MQEGHSGPLISVVVPVYNTSVGLFTRALDSVNIQMDEKLEMIVVDDGSEPESTKLYRKICNRYSNCKFYRKENAGVSAARNFGVEKAEGEYVLFLDSDDYLTDRCIQQAEEMIKRYHPDIVFGYVYKDLTDEGEIKYKTSDEIPKEIVLHKKDDIAALLNHILGYEDQRFVFEHGYLSDGPWCRFFRRKLFFCNEFDIILKWNEDTLWNIGLLSQCRSVVVCRSMWYVYAVRKGSATQSYRRNCYDEFRYITEKVSETSRLLWKDSVDKGTHYRVWCDLFFLSRTLVFHESNADAFSQKFAVLKGAIKSASYQRAIKTVDFHFEHRTIRRIVREFLNFTMKLHCYLLTYFIICLYVRRT